MIIGEYLMSMMNGFRISIQLIFVEWFAMYVEEFMRIVS